MRRGCAGAGKAAVLQAPRAYPFQHLLQVVSELHKQVNLPASIAVHRVDLGKDRENPDARKTPTVGEWVSAKGLERG